MCVGVGVCVGVCGGVRHIVKRVKRKCKEHAHCVRFDENLKKKTDAINTSTGGTSFNSVP